MNRKIAGLMLALVVWIFFYCGVCRADEDPETNGQPEGASAPWQPATNTIAFGTGMDAGGFGFRYAHELKGSPVELGVGVGFTGVSSQIQLSSRDDGCGLYIGTGLLVSPWNNLSASRGTILGVTGIGLQSRPKRSKGVYWNVGAEEFFILQGEMEGFEHRGFGVRLQIGKTF